MPHCVSPWVNRKFLSVCLWFSYSFSIGKSLECWNLSGTSSASDFMFSVEHLDVSLTSFHETIQFSESFLFHNPHIWQRDPSLSHSGVLSLWGCAVTGLCHSPSSSSCRVSTVSRGVRCSKTPFWDEMEPSYDLQESEGLEGTVVEVSPADFQCCHCDSIKRWLGHEDSSLVNGI